MSLWWLALVIPGYLAIAVLTGICVVVLNREQGHLTAAEQKQEKLQDCAYYIFLSLCWPLVLAVACAAALLTGYARLLDRFTISRAQRRERQLQADLREVTRL